jgi:hypothetical protein
MPGIPETIELYKRFCDDLAVVRDEQARFYAEHCYSKWQTESPWRQITAPLRRLSSRERIHAQLDDIEAEITYLRLRAHRPETVVEFSPNGGWSSTWILRALRDNDRGTLHSFDLVDTSTRHVPADLAGRWRFTQGDVRKADLPDPDYLFIDSDHSAEFARWYTADLLPKLRPGTPVSVHDILHNDPSTTEHEPAVITAWLHDRGIDWFTPSRATDPDTYALLMEERRRLGFGRLINYGTVNPMLFFTSG